MDGVKLYKFGELNPKNLGELNLKNLPNYAHVNITSCKTLLPRLWHACSKTRCSVVARLGGTVLAPLPIYHST